MHSCQYDVVMEINQPNQPKNISILHPCIIVFSKHSPEHQMTCRKYLRLGQAAIDIQLLQYPILSLGSLGCPKNAQHLSVCHHLEDSNSLTIISFCITKYNYNYNEGI